MNLDKKINDTIEYLKKFDKAAIAFSGGVDSTLVAKLCEMVPSLDCVLIHVDTCVLTDQDKIESKKFLKNTKLKVVELNQDVFEIEGFAQNSINRCYYCKKILFGNIISNAKSLGYDILFDGTNADDSNDFRPGMKAKKELKVVSPLQDMSWNKNEIREALKQMGLDIWEKPAMSCLATRIPTDEEITTDKLEIIRNCENLLFSMGFKTVRVRLMDYNANIEVRHDEINKFFDMNTIENIVSKFKDYGAKSVSLNLEGYKMGNMNKEK